MKSSRVLTQGPLLYPSSKPQYPIVFHARNPSHLSQRRSRGATSTGARVLLDAPSARTATGRNTKTASGRDGRRASSSAVSRDLPIPASPAIRTTWPTPVFALAQRRSSNSASSFRPSGQAGRVQRLKTAFHGTRPQRRPGPYRPGNALKVFDPEASTRRVLFAGFCWDCTA
jgi:hypothetical protein